MGWLYTHGATRADIVREIVSRPAVLDKRVTSGVVWTLERGADWRAPGTTVTSVGVYLIQSGGRRCPGWGYKAMDETMGPYYYGCPLALLDKADPPINEDARLWRAKVRAYHAARAVTAATRPAYGDLYRATREIALSRGAPVPAGSTVRVSSTTPTRAIVSTECGMVRLPLPLAHHGLVPLARDGANLAAEACKP